MDHLKTVLSEAVGKVCQQLLAYNTALKYECLLAVTVDSVTSLVFNLQGYAGTPVSTELLMAYHDLFHSLCPTVGSQNFRAAVLI